ncbi:hypothetical protein EVAR_22942_1 [Eumeta japonica]|uniref:Uncharacterized protein n=1 Tax=Eumeta variegata TaxID=151549 RepID=A0A4C1UUY1_EUMVA|nr:hypothetical protein EVAR_22942_1 [Eumeta japonica]
MPDWRYNVLSTSEAFIEALHRAGTDGAPAHDPVAASYPRRTDRVRVPHTCPYTTIFVGARSHRLARPQAATDLIDAVGDTYSVDRSSNLTDTSSFARYEDHRSHFEHIPSGDRDDIPNEIVSIDERMTVQVQKVPFTSSVFYVSARSEYARQNLPADVFPTDQESDSDALSSCTCDSFERCEFDCRDFEPFSDTCCCDPLGDGVCSRSPKDVDSPEHFCERAGDDDRASARSDMDGLDLTLFEPARAADDRRRASSERSPPLPSLCGLLHALPYTDNGERAVIYIPD